MNKGKLIVISGPSGCGKGTVINKLLGLDDNLRLSVSMTTREPRPGEIDGFHYYFVDNNKFKSGIDDNDFLEYAEYNGNYYGTPKSKIIEMQNNGINVILDIEVQGAEQVRNAELDNLTTIFLMPPSFEELRDRLNGRGTESEEVINNRLNRAKEEMAFKDKYDYIVVNDDLEKAVDDIYKIIKK